jgi:hypothetical protein
VGLEWEYGALQIPKIALERTYLNLPILKPSDAATISGAMKNQKGLLLSSAKKKFHKLGLHEPLARLNQLVQPDLSIMDCSNFCDERVLIAGDNTFEVDALASRMVGASEAEHLRISRQARAGGEDFEVVGSDVCDVRFRQFVEPSEFRQYLRLRVWSNHRACSMCRRVLSDIKHSPLRDLKYKLSMYWKLLKHALRGAEVVTGSEPVFVKDNPDVICIGDCTKKLAEDNGYIHVPGCPPSKGEMMRLGRLPAHAHSCRQRGRDDR